MSADNTILVLELKGNEFRVKHVTGIENLYYTWSSNTTKSEPIPIRVFEYFEDARPVGTLFSGTTKEKAMLRASEIYDRFNYVEYGIQIIKVDKTWREIVEESLLQAEDEIKFINTNPMFKYWEDEKKESVISDLETTKSKLDRWMSLHG